MSDELKDRYYKARAEEFEAKYEELLAERNPFPVRHLLDQQKLELVAELWEDLTVADLLAIHDSKRTGKVGNNSRLQPGESRTHILRPLPDDRMLCDIEAGPASD